MYKHVFVVVPVLIALLFKPQIALAQTPPEPIRGSWEGLKTIPPGDELLVVLRNAESLKGRVSSVSDTTLTLSHQDKTTDISRANVLKVHRIVSRSAKRSTMIGLGIGAGVGGLTGGIAGSRHGEPGEYGFAVLIVGTIGAGIGALTGYLIGSRKLRVLIYETR